MAKEAKLYESGLLKILNYSETRNGTPSIKISDIQYPVYKCPRMVIYMYKFICYIRFRSMHTFIFYSQSYNVQNVTR